MTWRHLLSQDETIDVKHANEPTYHGILNLDKPTGWTSHDVVARVRRLLRQRGVGHAGTLDPLATGVLLVCVGQATRVVEYLMAGRKVYRAVARLGETSDTYDSDGAITATAPAPTLTRDDLDTALAPFVGSILQRPPAYSAVKQNGVPAYRRARRGQVVELAPRPVTIDHIDLLDWQPPHLTIEVTCGPGAYIRSLTHDLGQSLGCGAVLTGLTRLRSGDFRLADAISLETLAEAAETGQVARYLHPLRSALADLTPVPVDPQTAAQIAHGQAIPCPTRPENATGCAYGPDGEVLAILIYDADRMQWRPRKVFATDESGSG
ncbi:MAG: tRNA pseudouridine(55) synthase TruB [Chloroflexi bacterium HGW-Chloroflexi-1]|nr:MAG: tRNA pseudouridine(55) synthase TruB [Chloroflexi bacterium HGW-Chloroflexi-1]